MAVEAMFVTFYDIENKDKLVFMEELSFVPCIGDKILIGKIIYVVTERMFSLEKKHRCVCYVKKSEK